MSKEVTLKFTRQQLEGFNRIWQHQIDWYEGPGIDKMVKGIVQELAAKFMSRAFKVQKEYRFTLKEYQAIALWLYLDVFQDAAECDNLQGVGKYEENLVRQTYHLLDQKTV